MLTPEQVKPYLLHPDEGVRTHAGRYFEGGWSDDPGLVPLILDATLRYGFEKNWQNFQFAEKLVVSEPSLGRLVELLSGTGRDDERSQIFKILMNAPGPFLGARLAEIGAITELPPRDLARARRRVEYTGWTGERLWSALEELSHRMDAADAPRGYGDKELSDDLLDALTPHDFPDNQAIPGLIRDLEPREGWLEVFLIELAGMRRVVDAIPILVEKLGEDDDFVPHAAAEALVRIGSPSVVPLILGRTGAAADEYYLLESAQVLGGIKHPDSEAAILQLLEGQTEDWVRTFLCEALCELVSEHAVPLSRKELASESGEALRELASPALAVGIMLGSPRPPEARLWEAVQRKQIEGMRRARSDYRSGPVAKLEGLADDEPENATAPDAVPVPIRNTAGRAGRNDPCPCGSGKKYKKCCGRSG